MIKRQFIRHIKNIPGWTTKRKIVVFSVDDYGNVRLSSEKARTQLGKAGLGINDCRFDKFDGLENAVDLAMLFDTLCTVKDKNGRNAVFTPYVNVANIDFESIMNHNFDTYRSELLPVTLNKLHGYEGTWQLWLEGIKAKIFIPQFHGREHLNIKLFNELLQNNDIFIKACIKNFSYTGLPLNYYKTIRYNETYSFNLFEENYELAHQIKYGLNDFEQIFGYRATNFNAPGAYEHEVLEKTMSEGGIRFIDTVPIKNEHQGNGIFKKKFRYWGKSNRFGQRYFLRNCVFEPSLETNAVSLCLKEIETAFLWGKPANISSHRINFNGVIAEENGRLGNEALRSLLKSIVKKWPEVEFMCANELGMIIDNPKNSK